MNLPTEIVIEILLNLPIRKLLYFHTYNPLLITENDLKRYIENCGMNHDFKRYFYNMERKYITRTPETEEVLYVLKYLYKYEHLISILNKNCYKKYLEVSSYSIKHKIERHYKKYISNDSTIKAFDIYNIQPTKTSDLNHINIYYKIYSNFDIIIEFLIKYEKEFIKENPSKYEKDGMKYFLAINCSFTYNKLKKLLL